MIIRNAKHEEKQKYQTVKAKTRETNNKLSKEHTRETNPKPLKLVNKQIPIHRENKLAESDYKHQ